MGKAVAASIATTASAIALGMVRGEWPTSDETNDTESKPDVDHKHTAKSSGRSGVVIALLDAASALPRACEDAAGCSKQRSTMRANGAKETTARATAVRVASLIPAMLMTQIMHVNVKLVAARAKKAVDSFTGPIAAHRRSPNIT